MYVQVLNVTIANTLYTKPSLQYLYYATLAILVAA